jgi:hypothetical protein
VHARWPRRPEQPGRIHAPLTVKDRHPSEHDLRDRARPLSASQHLLHRSRSVRFAPAREVTLRGERLLSVAASAAVPYALSVQQCARALLRLMPLFGGGHQAPMRRGQTVAVRSSSSSESSHRGLTRRLVAVRRRAILVLAKGERPQPRLGYWRIRVLERYDL